MEAHVVVARHHVNSGIFPRRKQRVEPENEKNQIFQIEKCLLAPLDIVLKLRGRAPEALVKEVAKEEYVLRTEISLGRLECPEIVRKTPLLPIFLKNTSPMHLPLPTQLVKPVAFPGPKKMGVC